MYTTLTMTSYYVVAGLIKTRSIKTWQAMVMVRIGKDGFDRSPPPPHGQHSVAVLGPLQSACALV